MSKPWGGVGAWALEAEQAEAEERELAASAQAQTQNPQSFPSLKEASQSKPKKKKPVPIPLTQFVADPHFDERPPTPTGPRERAQEELEFGRRGFSSYGGGGRAGRGEAEEGGLNDEQRREGRSLGFRIWIYRLGPMSVIIGPLQEQFAPMDRGRGQDRYGSLGGGSRADEVDNWAAGKKPVQSFGSGFRSSFNPASDSDRWVRGERVPSTSNGERRRLVLDPPKKDVGRVDEAMKSQTRPSPFGAARPREEVLTEKGLDWKKIDLEIEAKSISRPTSSHSSRPSSAQSNRAETPASQVGEGVRARPKVNPFGDAKPRELLLQAKGKDWRKIDLELEHRGVDRPETDEEKMLKKEIDHLKSQEADLKSEAAQVSADKFGGLHEQILQKERELEILIHQLDDKVRFGQKTVGNMRPGSGGGRIGALLDARPNSRSGVSEESRSSEFMERPRSRGGMTDAWAKPSNDKRGFQSGYFGDRSLDRPKSRERW
ncbi:eukaryotic translation initiation factor 4B2-like [Asparagus officinalis]|uniref:eukaryotic translation initiation factor 4B2-like n=1 Tax=Asparagus officinalis TaxID=4686 RepID=UPI00098E7923|nr:eukaryotic translation initiation factor 4B2-like [Asparagus officinalis]